MANVYPKMPSPFFHNQRDMFLSNSFAVRNKAWQLLWDHLDADQRFSIMNGGGFKCKGNHTNNTFYIFYGCETFNIIEMDITSNSDLGIPSKGVFWCLSTKDYVPFWDVMLAQFLLITTDELYFKEKANKDLAGILPYFYQLENE